MPDITSETLHSSKEICPINNVLNSGYRINRVDIIKTMYPLPSADTSCLNGSKKDKQLTYDFQIMALTHISGFELDKNNETPSKWLASAKTHMDLSYIHPIYLHKNITNITFLKRWSEDPIRTKIESDIFYIIKMSNFNSLVAHKDSKCSDAEWDEYVKMSQIQDNETSKNDLLPTQSKKYLEAKKLIELWNKYRGNYDSYAPEIGIAICFSCDRLVYTGERTKNIGNYNHIGMKRHWSSSYTSNQYCNVNYEKYLKIKQKSNSEYNFDIEYVLHRYRLWMQNAIKKVERAKEVGKKIKACTIIQRKWLEIFYRPDGLCASELALHYQLLWAVREEMRQINNA
ncbi:hypothetical protein Glove_360g15 [Diversispora epigaea]|uniref:Uncharacterized protein n=1 Tax=Diversispora epigaea TaxID=1348612 RepID=A0A397HAE6_9GLOM|nr:hypothetical protein Glove_360g15 [Diversispora epigaea]